MKPVALLLSLLASAGAALGQGRILWNEAVDGPLGSSTGTATAVGFLNLGTNIIVGRTEIEPIGGNWLIHADYLSFAVPPGHQLSGISFSVDNQAVEVWLGTPDFNNQIGYKGAAQNRPLFPQFGLQTLGVGGYGFNIANQDNQVFTSIANHRLDFVLTPVPEPSTWALLGLGGLAFWSLARRRSQP